MIIKMCGITRPADAAVAVDAGATWLGLNFWAQSKRCITPEQGAAVVASARRAGDVTIVGVFVNETEGAIAQAIEIAGLDLVQLHGDETPAQCAPFAGRYIKAFGLQTPNDVDRMADYDCDVVVVDAPSPGYGGSGELGDWELARRAVDSGRNIVLAGGLRADNVAAAITAVQPYGVDVAGGIESAPGIKDASKMAAFARAVLTG